MFAVAPGATLMGFQQTPQPQDALEEAADAGVDVISCSWGWDGEQSFPAVEASIRSIIEEGKIVLFASGNGQRAWPGSMPQVLSIGGVYANEAAELEASNYSSGYTSDLYPERRVPDVSGLVGQKPRAIYIMMPCPPSSRWTDSAGRLPRQGRDDRDRRLGWRERHEQRDAAGGWGGGAAPQEGSREGPRKLTLSDVRSILQKTAVPVQKGNNAQGFPAVGHPNIAVGFGLVDVTAALAEI